MKAIQMTGIKQLEMVEIPVPVPSEDEVLLKVRAVGVCGSDIPRINKYGAHCLPIIPGHEFAGEIEKVGAKVENWKKGDHVCVAPLLPCYSCEWCRKGEFSLCTDYKYYGSRNQGAFGEYLAVDPRNMVKLPDDLPFDWGAMVDPAANALHACFRAGLTPEDSICVYGLGAIGILAIQYAKAIGVKTVIAVDIHDMKLDVARKSGATICINSMKQDPVSAVREGTDGKGASVVLEMSGVPAVQNSAVLSASKMGRVVFLGISHSGLNLEKQAVDNILRYQLCVCGSWNSFSQPFPGKEWTESVQLMHEKKLNPDLIISDRHNLEDIPAVFKKIDEDPSFIFNKIMFYPAGM